MKYKKSYLSLTLLIGLLSVSILSYSNAWYNAPSGTSGNRRNCASYAITINQDPVEVYRQHYHKMDDPYNHFYSTHDYIAHFAIEYLSKSDFTGKYLWLTDLNRRYFYIYLLATEYPDYQSSAPKLTLDCGKSTQIKNDFSIRESHKLGPSMGLAERRALEVYIALNKKDENNNPEPWFETAAFYLGSVTHYVAEMAHPHHASGIGTKWYHAWLESEVSKLTTLEDFRDKGLNSTNFFTINLEKILGWSSIFDGFISLEPREAVDKMAKVASLNNESYFRNQNNGTYNAQYFYDFYSKDCGSGRGSGNFKFLEIGRDGSNLPTSLSYLAGNYRQYFDRLEVLLNYAVYFTACVLKYILKNFSGQVIPCQDNDDDDNNPQRSDNERDPPFDSFDILVRVLPLIAAFVTVGIAGRKTIGGAFR